MKINKIILIAIALVIIIGIQTYNSFISKTNNIEGAWAQLETQYQRRYDLIPNLVNSTKGLMKQERTVFEAVNLTREKYAQALHLSDKIATSQQMDIALGRLIAIVENYPQLKSDQVVLGLMDELAGTENRVAVARLRYNDCVKNYNTYLKQFPAKLIGMMFDFQSFPYFKIEEKASIPPIINLE